MPSNNNIPLCPRCHGKVSVTSDIKTWKRSIQHPLTSSCKYGEGEEFNSTDEALTFWYLISRRLTDTDKTWFAKVREIIDKMAE